MAKIAIDLQEGTVEKIQGFSLWKKHRKWSLGLFDKVRIVSEASSAEDGYGIIRHSVFLEAPGVSLELLSTGDEQYARSLYRGLRDALMIRKIVDKIMPQS